MIIPEKFHQFLDTKAIIVTVGKEHGRLYRAAEGVFEEITELENHPPSYSDDEGFFFGGGGGGTGAPVGGAPKEYDESVYLKAFAKSVGQELNKLIKAESPQLIYLFEPEHLKGRIEQEIHTHELPHLTIHTVKHGNYVQSEPQELLKHIDDFIEDHEVEQSYEEDLKQSS